MAGGRMTCSHSHKLHDSSRCFTIQFCESSYFNKPNTLALEYSCILNLAHLPRNGIRSTQIVVFFAPGHKVPVFCCLTWVDEYINFEKHGDLRYSRMNWARFGIINSALPDISTHDIYVHATKELTSRGGKEKEQKKSMVNGRRREFKPSSRQIHIQTVDLLLFILFQHAPQRYPRVNCCPHTKRIAPIKIQYATNKQINEYLSREVMD